MRMAVSNADRSLYNAPLYNGWLNNMALTNAERQARWQQRRKAKTQRLEAEILDLRQQLAQAQHEIEALRAQLDEAAAPKPAPKRRGDPLARLLYPTPRRR
jgi:hypothetical protein